MSRDNYGEALKHLASILDKAQGVTCIATEKQIDIGREVLKLRGILDEFQAIVSREGEVERLTQCLAKANEQTEHFEREWYLRGDKIEELEALASRETVTTGVENFGEITAGESFDGHPEDGNGGLIHTAGINVGKWWDRIEIYGKGKNAAAEAEVLRDIIMSALASREGEALALGMEEFIAAKKYYTTIANPEEMDGTESVSVAELREFMRRRVATASPQAAVRPVAAVTGYYGGHCVIEPIDRAQLLPVGMALYSGEQAAVLAVRIWKLESLAIHLRHCRECGEMDLSSCQEGSDLWDAVMLTHKERTE
jgi:hypothetical protein